MEITSVEQIAEKNERHRNVSELKQRLIEAWPAMQQCVVDKAIDEWRNKTAKRLRFCVSAKGGNFEHKL